MTSERTSTKTLVPLAVDLDGTLIRTDMFAESLLLVLKSNLLSIFQIPVWWSKGRANMKAEIARRVSIDPASLPYIPETLALIDRERSAGRKVYLATASDTAIGKPIADHLGIFDGVIASDGKINYSGSKKLTRLESEFGKRQFDYVGNSSKDLAVWKGSNKAYVVNALPSVVAKAKQLNSNTEVLSTLTITPKNLTRTIRVQQWVKNLLVFVPLISAHSLFDLEKVFAAVLAFFAFSLCGSAVYVLNDIMDLPADRKHLTKRFRPLASGVIPIEIASTLIPILIVLAFLVACFLPREFSVLLLTYLIGTTLYTLKLKAVVLIDIFLLASFYVLRLLAGGAAASIQVSEWLLAFSLFLFLSLALAKRCSELHSLKRQNRDQADGRGYRVADLEQLASFGSASGYISVLILALYVNSAKVIELYKAPQYLWFICPIMLYWMSRVWLLAHRGKLHEDPIVFALKDKTSYAVLALCVIFFILAS